MAETKSSWDKKPPKKPQTDKDKALAVVLDTSEEKQRFSAYIPESQLRKLKRMSADSVTNVAVNDLVIEAVEDLIAKYDAGKGRHAMVQE